MIDLGALFSPSKREKATPAILPEAPGLLETPAVGQKAPEAALEGKDDLEPVQATSGSSEAHMVFRAASDRIDLGRQPEPAEVAPAEDGPTTGQPASPAAVAPAAEVGSPAARPTARRFDLEGFPAEARPVLEEFAAGMGEALLAISKVACSWADCRFPATVLIRTQEERNGMPGNLLLWGCPKCGREYQPQLVSAKEMDRIEEALGFGERKKRPSSPSKAVCPCGSTAWTDTPIHGGKSVRRNCQQCGRFLGFPLWYGKPQEDRPGRDPITPEKIQALLDRAAAHGWPELELSPWDVVGPGPERWAAFGRYLARPQPTQSSETTRLRSYQLALLHISEMEAQNLQSPKWPLLQREPGLQRENMPILRPKP